METIAKSHDIIIILDESGSMGNLGVEPVQAVNVFIKDQQKCLNDRESTFTLWKFNSIVSNVIDNIPLYAVKEFTDYNPSSMTALNDAIGTAISTKKQKANFKDVICLIVTDGLENCSSQYNSQQIKKMISEMETEHGWKFIYIGANQDSFAVGQTIGVNRCANFDISPGGLSREIKSMSNAVSAFRHSSATNTPMDDIKIEQPVNTCPANLYRQGAFRFVNKRTL